MSSRILLALLATPLLVAGPLLAQRPIPRPTAVAPRTMTLVGGAAVTGLKGAATAITATLTWAPASGASAYKIYRALPPRVPFAVVATVSAPTTTFKDTGVYPGMIYSYQIGAVYAGGEASPSAPVSLSTLPGAPPTWIKGTVTGVGQVSLTWPAASDAAAYAIWRDGTPLTNNVPGTSWTDTQAPSGTHVYTVGSMFQPVAGRGLVEGQLTNLPSASVATLYGIYSLILERLSVTNQTKDALFEQDGKGDEVYVTVDVSLLDKGKPSVIPTQQLRSWTYGDVGADHVNRIRAGSADASNGGIRTGDAVPDTRIACQSQPPDHYCLPLEIFRGQLAQDALAVMVVPTIWEYDGTQTMMQQLLAYQVNQLQQIGTGGFNLPSDSKHVTTTLSNALNYSPLNPTGGLAFVTSMGDGQADRPIGLQKTASGSHTYDSQVISLTYQLADALLSNTAQIGGLYPGEFTITYRDGPDYEGLYVATFLVRRCASMTSC